MAARTSALRTRRSVRSGNSRWRTEAVALRGEHAGGIGADGASGDAAGVDTRVHGGRLDARRRSSETDDRDLGEPDAPDTRSLLRLRLRLGLGMDKDKFCGFQAL